MLLKPGKANIVLTVYYTTAPLLNKGMGSKWDFPLLPPYFFV